MEPEPTTAGTDPAPELETGADVAPVAEGFVAHARTFAALTLVSRLFGLGRDALLARVIGVGAVGSAFNIAFQFPNTFRRLFGEGALSAALIPEYARLLKSDPEMSRRFASLTVALLVLALGVLAALGELILALLFFFTPLGDSARDVLILLMIMLPYMPLVCLTAVLGGVLQVHGRFAPQAGAPIIINVGMIGAGAAAGVAAGAGPMGTAIAVSVAVSIAGVLQVAWCAWALRPYIRWTRAVAGVADSLLRMLRRMGPVVIGLGALQLSTLIEQLIAGWPVIVGPTIGVGGAVVDYPMDEGSSAMIAYSQRLYQFPLGIFGIALATAVFPLLSRQADDPERFGATLRHGLRLSLFIGLPATAGMVWVARELTAVIYLGGEVGREDVARMALLLALYGPLVGAYSLTHVLTRAFYAAGDTKLPMKMSLGAIALSLVLTLVLMWRMSERGIALASSIAAVVQVAALAGVAHRRLGGGRLFDRETVRAVLMSVAGVGVMLLALWALSLVWAHDPEAPWGMQAARLAADCALGAGVYGAFALVMRRPEVRWLVGSEGV